MEILEHGIYYNNDKEITCNCGCKFKYNKADIRTDHTLAYTTCPEQFKEYVLCPECNRRIDTGYMFSIY